MKNTHLVTRVAVDGTITTTECNKDNEYETLSKAVALPGGSMIETLPYFSFYQGKRCRAYCNEEGLYLSSERNPKGWQLWLDGLPKNNKGILTINGLHSVVGPIAIIQKLEKPK